MQLSVRFGSAQAQLRPQRSCIRPQDASRMRFSVATRAAFDEQNVGVEVPNAFKQALQEAMERQKEQRERAASSSSSGAGSDYDRSSWRSSGDVASGTSSWRSNDTASSNGSASSNGYSSSSSGRSWRAPAAPQQVQDSAGTPLMQVLATALSQSRTTLERLQAEEAEIENLIQKEQKQVERLEWLVGKVQQDYAYFNQVEQRFNQSTAAARAAERTTSGYVDNGNGSFKW